MGLFDNLFGRKKTIVGIDALARLVSGGTWSNEALLTQYGKSVYVFAAVNKIATKVASIDLTLHEITNSKGDVRDIPSHQILDLLYRPNPFQTRSEFWKITVVNKKLTGEAIWLKVRNNRSQVVELWNLRPDLITVVSDPQKYILRYELSKSDGTKVNFEPEDIIHFKEVDPTNQYRGISPLRAAQSRVETEEYATNFQRDFFLNNARPDALLISEDTLAPEQRDELRAGWNSKHRGRGKSSRIGILEGGMQYQQVSVTQKEMAYIESLKFTRDDILVAFGVPKSVITTDDVNYANANSGLKTFLAETIKPEVVQLVEVINEMLVIPEFGERFYVDFEDPTPVDRQTELQEWTAGVDKWYTRNEIREKLGLDPVEGGDSLYTPAGSQEVGTPPPSPTEQNPPENDPNKVFRGRGLLKMKLEMAEKATEEVLDGVQTKSVTPKTTLLKTVEAREIYESYVNKAIDRRASRFQKDVTAAARKQESRVLASMEKLFAPLSDEQFAIQSKGGMVGIKAVTDVINFDKRKENKLFTELALPFMIEAASEAGVEAMELIGVGETFDFTEAIEKKLRERAKFFAKSVNDTTLEKLSSTLAEGLEAGEGIGQLRDRVKGVYSEFSDYRAERIARTEATAANNEGFLEAYKQSKVVNSHEWVATKDLRTRPEHVALDGEIREVGKNFSNGLPYPQEPNCRCVLAPVV